MTTSGREPSVRQYDTVSAVPNWYGSTLPKNRPRTVRTDSDHILSPKR